MYEEAGRIELPEAQIRTVVLRSPFGLQIELVERADSVTRYVADAYEAAGVRGYSHWALAVDDLERSVDSLLAAGAAEVPAPANTIRPGFRYAYLSDPEGNLIELTQPSAT